MKKLAGICVILTLFSSCDEKKTTNTNNTNALSEKNTIDIQISEFKKILAEGDIDNLSKLFSDQILISGRIGDLYSGKGFKWKMYTKDQVVDEYRKLERKVPRGMRDLEKANPVVLPVRKYSDFPDFVDVSQLKDDDIVVDFRASESLYGVKRHQFDDAPVTIFREIDGSLKIVAQILSL